MPIPFLVIGALVATGAGGVGAGVVGGVKMSDANKLIKKQKELYDNKKDEHDDTTRRCINSLDLLRIEKILVWRDFDIFSKAYEKIKIKPEFTGKFANEQYSIPKVKLDEIKTISISAGKMIGAGALAAGTGGAIAGGALSGVAAFGTASTGTAIASLSGAAATNATLATIGGGSLASGGLGMAGGTAILGGMVAAPALAIGGIFMAVKGNSSIEKANEIKNEVSRAIRIFNESISFLNDLSSTADNICSELKKLHNYYIEKVNQLTELVQYKTDFNDFNDNEKSLLEANILLIGIMKKLTETEIVKKKDDNNQYVDKKEVEDNVKEAEVIFEKINVA